MIKKYTINKFDDTYLKMPFYIENLTSNEIDVTFFGGSNSPIINLKSTAVLPLWGNAESFGQGKNFVIRFAPNQRLYFCAECDTWTIIYNYSAHRCSFSSTGEVAIGGNIMSLLYGEDFQDKKALKGEHSFSNVFANDEHKIRNIDNLRLPATELTPFCYSDMFWGSKFQSIRNLILPALELEKNCYQNMFFGSAIESIELDIFAQKFASQCCDGMFSSCEHLRSAENIYMLAKDVSDGGDFTGMFQNCTSLEVPLELPATKLSNGCYRYMFRNCTSLKVAPELSAMDLAPYCYTGMFANCSSLVEAPELLATHLYQNCYESMFAGCSALTTVQEELPAEILAFSCYKQMFYNCTSLTTIPNLPAMNLENSCYYGMFSGCSALTNISSSLPATELKNDCYNSMFYGCTSLVEGPELFGESVGIGAPYYYKEMFRGCTSLNSVTIHLEGEWNVGATNFWLFNVSQEGTIHNLGGSTNIPSDSESGCPTGWVVVNN